jgi:4-amino-4-deoxy-L-arabinose transferase-like glycosyltransferase
MPNLYQRLPTLKSLLLAGAVLAGFYGAYFSGLGANPLLDPDEPIYAVFIRGMVNGGDWLTPHYAGQIWFDKPPLFYWLSSSCARLIGLSELSIRMPSAICAALLVVMVYFLASLDFGRRAAMLAAAVMGTSLMQLILSHAAATDAIMVFLMTASLYAYRRWLASEDRGRSGWIAMSGTAAGLGMLAKGPVVPLLLLITYVAHLAWMRQLRRIRAADVVLGGGAALLIGLPWYAAMYSIHGKLFVDQFIVTNNLTRFAAPLHKYHAAHWYSHFRNIPMLLGFFLPWTVFLPQALVRSRRAGDPGTKLALCWGAVVLVFFSLSKTQNFTYTFPAFPACAVLVGAFLSQITTKKFASRSLMPGLYTGLGLVLLVSIGMVVMVKDKFPAASQAAIPAAAVLALLFAVPVVWMLIRRSSVSAVPWMLASGMIAFNLVLVHVLMPQVADYMSTRTLAHRVLSLHKGEVVAFRLWRPGLVYYLQDKPVDVSEPSDAKKLASRNSPVLFVCNERDEKMLEAHSLSEVYGCGNLDVYANRAYLDKARTR